MSFVSCPEKNRNKRLDQEYSNRFIESLLSRALEENRAINFLSLPAHEWIHERNIVEKFPENKFCFWGCESNPSIHSMAVSVAEQLTDKYGGRAIFQMTHNPGKLSEALVRATQTGIPDDHIFNVIYADYCGYVCSAIMNDMCAILSDPRNNGGSRSVLMLTVGLKVRNSVHFCNELIRKWEDSPSFNSIHIDDGHMHKRIDKGTYSINTLKIVRALALEIKYIAETNPKNKAGFFRIFDPHIYYGPRNYGNGAPQIPMGTLAFRREF